MMGYSKTYSPLSTNEYKSKSMVKHLLTLLNHLQINKVVVIGHGWGISCSRSICFALSWANIAGVVLIIGSYNVLGLFDLDRALESFKKVFGYETYGYWKFFEANDATAIIENILWGKIELGQNSN
jgi:soluble epoxide hydrolase/lipid-phosphate phosphatase